MEEEIKEMKKEKTTIQKIYEICATTVYKGKISLKKLLRKLK